MRSKFPIKTKIAGLVITTFLLIILALSLYLFVVIRNNERQIINRSFRTLAQIGENIKIQHKTYVKNVAYNAYFEKDSTRVPEDSVELLIKNEVLIYRVKPTLEDYISYVNREDSLKEIGKEELYNRIKREDVFDAFILRKGDSSIIYNTLPFNIKMNNPIKQDSTVWQAGDVDLVTIAAIDYKRFTIPLKISENDWWYMDGLIDNDAFQNEKKSLGTWFVIIMFILFIFIVLSFPVLRLFLMSSVEQMRRSNLFMAGTSIVIGSSLVAVLLISLLSNNAMKTQRKARLKNFADTVYSEFVNEINLIYEQLKLFDSADTVYAINDVLLADSIPPAGDSLFYLPEKYTNFKTMFWMDSTGQQLQELKKRQAPVNLINLSYRNYFKNKDAWVLPGSEKKDKSSRFMIESIYSNTSGDALAAVSTRSTGKKTFIIDSKETNDKTYHPKAMAITAPMYTLMDPVLPKGYTFSIIDSEGNVWFHSNKHRNLQENLLEECSYSNKLRSAIFSRTPESISIGYQNKDYLVYILPIQNIPLFIVAMEKSTLINSYNSTIITLTFIFIIAFLLFIGIQVFILKITNRKNTKLKRKEHSLDWLLPQKTNTKKYTDLFLGHILILISLFLLFLFSPRTENYLINAFFLFLYVQIFIAEKARLHLKNKTHKINAINIPFFKKNKLDSFSIISVLFLIIINIYHKKVSENYLGFLLFQGLILFIVLIPWSTIFYELKNKIKKPGKTTVSNESRLFLPYQLFVITWLLLISFFPTIIFFQKALLVERIINRKYQQLYLVREFQKRNYEIDTYYAKNEINDTKDHYYRNQRKNKGIYSDFLGITIREDKNKCDSCREMKNTLADSLLLNLRPLYTSEIVENRKLIFNTSTDFRWKRKPGSYLNDHESSDSLLLNFNSTEIQAKDSVISKPQVIAASLKKETILGGYGFQTLLFWLLLILFILLIYKLLENVLRRIFPFNTQGGALKISFGELLTSASTTEDWPAYTFAVNLSGKDSEARKTEAKAMGFHCFEVSGSSYEIDNLNNEDKVVILNFGFIMRSVELFNDCINLIEELLNKNVNKIIISSYVSPTQIQEFYENQAKKITDENEQKKIAANLNRIKQLLMEFSVINCSLQRASIKQIDDDRFSTIIKSELEKDVFLASLKPLILKYCTSNNSIDEEDVILYIQKLASNYYEKIWSSCTTEEKILLFDLAEDSLVNIKNIDAYIPLRNLQEKGIVEVNDKYKVMNESFRNYILTNVETADLENTEIMKQRKSAWNSFRIPLILFASGIVIFLLATQQALVSNLYTLLIAVGAIAGVFIRISGMFSSKNNPPAEPKSN